MLSFNYANIHAISPMILYFLDIPRILLEQKTDIPRIFFEHECIFLRVNVTFYDAVNMMHDVISTPDPIPYTGSCIFMFVGLRHKFMFVGLRHNKTQQIRR